MLNKILYSDNGTLTDLTPKLLDYYSNSYAMTIVAAEDSIYIGSKFPFTRKYFKVSTANTTVNAVPTIKYWDGATFRSAVDVTDETGLAGKPFANSGYLSFVLDKQYGWASDDTVVNGATKVTGLGDVTIYDMYWIKLTYDGAVPATLFWMGDVFCTDSDLASEYPDLARSAVMTAFAASKTSWEEQRMVATELVIGDLKRLGVTPSGNKVLSLEQLRRATVAKTAELVFSVMEGMGDAAKQASVEYGKRMDPRFFDVDSNGNGRDDVEERGIKISRAYR